MTMSLSIFLKSVSKIETTRKYTNKYSISYYFFASSYFTIRRNKLSIYPIKTENTIKGVDQMELCLKKDYILIQR